MAEGKIEGRIEGRSQKFEYPTPGNTGLAAEIIRSFEDIIFSILLNFVQPGIFYFRKLARSFY